MVVITRRARRDILAPEPAPTRPEAELAQAGIRG